MKKLILIFIFLLSFSFTLNTFATDACDKLILQEASFIWKASFASNLRDYPCVSKSNVLWVSKAWENYEVISKVDGWYKIKTSDNKIYWIRDKSITKTSGYVQQTNTTVQQIDNTVVKQSGYILTSQEKILINRFVYKVNNLVQTKGIIYRNALVSRLSQLLDRWNYSLRLTTILQELKSKISEITIIEKETVSEKTTYTSNSYSLDNIDIWRVKDAWLSWYNWVRNNLWLGNYSYNSTLESTALDWSKTSKARWDITHKRSSWDAYYDYNKITSWFADRWVVCKNVNRITHTENIWRGTYSCNDGECTDELIKWIRSTFDFFLAEKGKSYDAHYRSIVQPYFKKIWLWIELEELRSWYFKYYLTVHFCTELIN